MTESSRPTRRALLRTLGLTAMAAYAAPLLTPLSDARASGSGGGGRGGRGGGRRSSQWPSAASAPSGGRRPARRRPEFVVAAPDAAAIAAIEGAGYQVLARARIDFAGIDIARIRSRAGRTLAQARAEIEALAPGTLTDINHLYRPEELTCSAEDCAAFQMIGWSAAGTCTLSPVIGMIDTGVNRHHPALADRAVDVITLDTGRRAASRIHGTAVAALLVGSHASRTPGLLPDARLVAVDAFHGAGNGDAADAFNLARAAALLAERKVSVVNMSFSGAANVVLERIVARLSEAGIALVAAAGNAGPRAAPLYPAAYPSVIAVTAVDGRNNIYRQAAAGPHISFAAPGVRLWTAASVSGGRLRSGTSYAAPFVTAAVAAARAKAPDAPLDEIVRGLAASAEDLGTAGRDEIFGFGLVRTSPCA